MLKDSGIDEFSINLSAQHATSKPEPGRERGRTCAFVDRQSLTKGVGVEDLFQGIGVSSKSKSDVVGCG
jgi:hypothetical protein